MAITRVNFTSATAGATTMVINVPASVVDNDYLLLVIHCATNTAVVTTPTGWTSKGIQVDNVNGQKMWWYHKMAASEPASYTVTVSPAEDMAAFMVAYRGTVTTLGSVVEAQASANNGNTAVQSSPSVTSLTNNAMLVAFFGANSNADMRPVTPDASPAASEIVEVYQLANHVNLYGEDYVLPTAGAQVLDCTFTTAPGAGCCAAMMALQPGSGGSTGSLSDTPFPPLGRGATW